MLHLKQLLTVRSNIHSLYELAPRSVLQLPLYGGKVAAGFPSPADDHIDRLIDLNEHLVDNPDATYVTTASGESMTGVGIHDGDTLIVDCSLEAKHGDIVIVALNGELTCKQLRKRGSSVLLESANPNYQPIELQEGDDMRVWGVVKHSLHKL